jgi:hypothetical protein
MKEKGEVPLIKNDWYFVLDIEKSASREEDHSE